MTPNPLSDVSITNSEEFEVVLTALVEKADQAGVDVRGAWEFQTRGSIHEWEVEITELARESDEGEDT